MTKSTKNTVKPKEDNPKMTKTKAKIDSKTNLKTDQRSADKKAEITEKGNNSVKETVAKNDQRSVEQQPEKASEKSESRFNADEKTKTAAEAEKAAEEHQQTKAEEANGLQAARAKRGENDQWSVKTVVETGVAASATEDNSKNTARSKDHLESTTKAELKDTGTKRRRRTWVWWLVGVIVVILLGIGVVWAFNALWGFEPLVPADQSEITEPEPETPEAPAEPETPAEAEKPTEEEKPAEPEPKPSTSSGGETLPPLAQRPQSSDYPDITSNKVIALTFDDGPSAATTPRLLDILKGRDVKVTFFVLGNLARRAPDIIRREAAEGHEVASHTPYHDQLTLLSATQVRAQALEMDQIFTDILGTVPPFTRPPYGSYNDTVRNALGQPLIIWSIDPRDWADRNASIVCSRVTSAAFDGAIILVHDIHATTVDAVPCIIDNLRAQGYQFLTVSELAAAKNIPLVNGGVYGSF